MPDVTYGRLPTTVYMCYVDKNAQNDNLKSIDDKNDVKSGAKSGVKSDVKSDV